MVEVRTIAVIGAGPVGRAIARAAAVAGYRTILEDILPSDLRSAEAEIRATLEMTVARAEASTADATAALARIEFGTSVEDAARQADSVIEAVPEDIDSKIEIFTLLDKVCRPHTLLATNAISTRVGDLAAMTFRPLLCIGMRFSGAAAMVAPLEIVCGPETSDATLSTAMEIARRMQRQTTLIRE